MRDGFVGKWLAPLLLAACLGTGALVFWMIGVVWTESIVSGIFGADSRATSAGSTISHGFPSSCSR